MIRWHLCRGLIISSQISLREFVICKLKKHHLAQNLAQNPDLLINVR